MKLEHNSTNKTNKVNTTRFSRPVFGIVILRLITLSFLDILDKAFMDSFNCKAKSSAAGVE